MRPAIIKVGLILILFVSYIWLQNTRKIIFLEKLQSTNTIEVVGEIDEVVQYRSNTIIVVDDFELLVKEFPQYQLGDKIWASGSLEDRVSEKNLQRIRLVNPEIKLILSAGKHSVLSTAWWMIKTQLLQQKLKEIAFQSLSSPHASLLYGIVWGGKQALPQDFYEALIATGTIHVIAASGFNVAVVAKLVFTLSLFFLRRRLAVVLSIVAIGCYAVLSGLSEPVLRATLMGILAFGAQGLGRESVARWSMVFSALVMLLVSPTLIGSISFQLSFLSTAGILFIASHIMAIINNVRKLLLQKINIGLQSKPILNLKNDDKTGLQANEKLGFGKRQVSVFESLFVLFNESLSTTIAATIATLPVIMISFGRISLISPLVNVLVLWLVPMLMVAGLGFFISGLLSLEIARLIGILLWPLLEIFIQLVRFFGAFSWASIEIKGANWFIGVGYYLTLIALLFIFKPGNKTKNS